ncbi:sigma-54-dependent transcriptional regulator [Candidatus Phycosocius spiralis]|uniref:DNA-binding transcriptional regulator NtrC n=1 Tax=Candidatus Phycosocius spiralis TaxID=2815099 RepID=A0ABQ4PW55_9PROT|nr:sigma-54 dependent transcriptional regulator [Candidatus Phycosocius spiralis]GIU67160.1 sigma-54-dependent Fis family transcriptional regulator [Candidatus Phycosocius spiralis]
MSKTVLIVDDDPSQRRLLQAAVERQGFATRSAEDGAQAIAQALDPAVDVVLLDLIMPGVSGMEALAAIRTKRDDLPIIVLTASGGIDTVVKAMQAGASDFFVKPASPERVLVSIRNALKVGELSGEVKRLKKKATGTFTFIDMVAGAFAMRQVIRLGQRAAASNIPVLILGESGVGKEVIARAIHGESERSGRPIITVNCGAIPENLVESILFGHEKGAFTGAHERHLGKFQEAAGGTLFLDEVGELPLDMQVKLLRALQEGEVDPIGSKRPIKLDVRMIAATNKDLAKLVAEGRFREDLYYRLNVFPIDVPPLRDRMEDIQDLVKHFVTRINAEEGKCVLGISPHALMMLQKFDWPGNVRQLENAVFRAVVLSDGDFLQPEDFPHIQMALPHFPVQSGENDAPKTSQGAPIGLDLANMPAKGDGLAAALDHTSSVAIFDPAGHLRTLEQIERDLIECAIDLYAGHMTEVARRLGIGRSTLYRKLKEYDLVEHITQAAG